ncbi:hypothetical protein Sjap_012213 [Stephania japonica]|uniref:Uncharacterized protein n=1 Tax=Stephania japonica TaxID=461633 RepID=A0AAP0IY00_9MAGN
MAEREVVETSPLIFPSPPNPTTQISDSIKSNPPTEEEEPETRRRSKKRKKCPEPLVRGSSFSFDTKFKSARTPDSTPKFGSFASAAAAAVAVAEDGGGEKGIDGFDGEDSSEPFIIIRR